MKKLLLALLIAACSFALAPMAGQAYATGDEDDDNAQVTEEDFDVLAEDPFYESDDEDTGSVQFTAKAVDPAAAYRPVLDEYTNYLERLESKEKIDPYNLKKYGYKYINESIAICATDENYTGGPKSRPEYAFIDIDGNGIVELVIGSKHEYPSSGTMNGYAVGSIFTLDSNMAPKKLIDSYSYRYREHITIYKNGVIEDGGSGGAEVHIYSFYTIGSNAKLILQDELMEDWGTFTYNNRSISKSQFLSTLNQLQNKTKASLTWNGFPRVAAYDKKLAKVKISSVKPAKKKMTVKWKKLSKKQRKTCSRIEVQYSLNKSFPWKQTVTKTVKKSAKKAKIKRLKAKKNYYVKVRTIKVVNGVKHVSKWSKVKKVKTK